MNMRISSLVLGMAAAVGAVMSGAMALAQEGLAIVGAPVDGRMGFQEAVTEMSRDLQFLDHMLLWIITLITILVTALLVVVGVRFHHKRNPTPASFTHNSPLEIAWTLIPIVILVVIGAFSLPILFKSQEIPTADITIKATGHQWYWNYEYVDHEFGFDSFLLDGSTKVASLPDDQIMGTPEVLDDVTISKLEAMGYSRNEWLLATDTALVIPVGKTIVVQVTGADVIHAWAVPAFGVMQSGVPGRLSELWFKVEKEGIYFGQCTALCGKSHAYMPITVKVVSEAAYEDWLTKAQAEYAGTPAPVALAANN